METILGGNNDSTPLSLRAKTTTSVSDARRLNRSGSISKKDAALQSRPVSSTLERNRDMNERVEKYMNDFPISLTEALNLNGGGSGGGGPGVSRTKSRGETDIQPMIPEEYVLPSPTRETVRRRISIADQNQKQGSTVTVTSEAVEKEGGRWKRTSGVFSNLLRRRSTAT
jgi:hypothetical protein